MLRKNWSLIIPCASAVAFSILAVFYFGAEKTEFGDVEDYINAARAFLDGTPYPRQSVYHPMFRPPLYPLFIAGVWLVFPDSIVAVKLAQALLHGATVWAIYQLAYEILRKPLPAFLGAMVCAVNPLLVAHTVDLFTEPLHTFLCALAMLMLTKLLKAEAGFYRYAFCAGVAFGLATLCRPAILGVALCLVAAVPLLHLREIKRVKYLTASAVLLASIFLTIAPWTIYNYRMTGEFILVNDGFSYNLWLGNLPETIVLYEGGFKTKEENERFAGYVWGQVKDEKLAELERNDNYSSLKLNEREKLWRREAVEVMSRDYGLTARLMFGKLWAFWTPFLNHFTYGYKIVALVGAFVIGIYIFGIYGARVFAGERAGRRFIVLLGVSFLATTAIHVLIFGFVRYRVPNVDPYLSMLAGVALWHIGAKFFSQSKFFAQGATL